MIAGVSKHRSGHTSVYKRLQEFISDRKRLRVFEIDYTKDRADRTDYIENSSERLAKSTHKDQRGRAEGTDSEFMLTS